MTDTTERPRAPVQSLRKLPGRRPPTVVAVAAGMLAGVLVMNLTASDRPSPAAPADRAESGGGTPALAGEGAGGSSPTDAPGTAGESDATRSDPGGAASLDGPSEPTQAVGPAPDGGPARQNRAEQREASGTDARGVTDTTITLGFVFFDVGAFGAVPAFRVGDGREHLGAVVEAWEESGRDVVHGRKIEFAYREWELTDSSTEREACVGIIDDDEAFAVIAPYSLGETGANCVAIEKNTPLLTFVGGNRSDGMMSDFADRYPNHFAVAPGYEVIAVNWMHWAHHRGILQDKTIGLYYPTEFAEKVDATIKTTIDELGYEIAVEVSSDSSQAGPEDSVAVNRFREEGVDLAILDVNAVAKANFMQQAESQLYRPTYIASDIGETTQDSATEPFNEDQYDGTFAMTTQFYGQRGSPLPPETVECTRNWERHTGRSVEVGLSEWNFAMQTCNTLELARETLEHAGPDLSHESYIAGMEAIEDHRGAFSQGTSFSPRIRQGTYVQRTIQWHRDCRCYQKVTEFSPLFVRLGMDGSRR